MILSAPMGLKLTLGLGLRLGRLLLIDVQQAVIAVQSALVRSSLGTQWINPRLVVWAHPMFTRSKRQKSSRDKRKAL